MRQLKKVLLHRLKINSGQKNEETTKVVRDRFLETAVEKRVEVREDEKAAHQKVIKRKVARPRLEA